MRHLGWHVIVIVGVVPATLPPKSWKISCKATFAWWCQLSPQLAGIASALGEAPLLVCEDTMVPSDWCTPDRIKQHYESMGEKPQWLGCYLKPKRYEHWLGNRRWAGTAAAGCKMFYANACFWNLVALLFHKTPKQFCTDAHFQTLVFMGMLHFNYPVWAATPAHFSTRTNSYEGASPTDLQHVGRLLNLEDFGP